MTTPCALTPPPKPSLTAERLTARGIAVRLLRATGLTRGPAMAERARAERYRLLTAACAEAGILHLLLGHHAADQAETVMIRVLRHSADRGLAAMPALAGTASLRLLRPLLTVPPEHLRRMLTRAGMPWIEDPSNRDPKALRARLRAVRGVGTQALCVAAASAGRHRAERDRAVAAVLADRVSIRPEGFADPLPRPDRAGRAGRAGADDRRRALCPGIGPNCALLAAAPGPATLAGVRLLPAGRLGPGWLVVRKPRRWRPRSRLAPVRFGTAASASRPMPSRRRAPQSARWVGVGELAALVRPARFGAAHAARPAMWQSPGSRAAFALS